MKPNLGGDGSDCAIDPFDPSQIFSVSWALGPPVVFKSADGGAKWTQWRKGMVGNGDRYHHPLVFHDDGSLFASAKQVFRLPHGSDTWHQIGDLQLPTDAPWRVTAIALTSDPNVLYAYGDQLYRTDNARSDSAASWAPLKANMGDAVYWERGGSSLQAIEADPENPRRIWASFRNYDKPFKVYFSEDGGTTWGDLSRGLPQYPVSALAAQPGTDAVLYAGTDVGVFVNFDATDPGSEWQPFNAGLPVCLVNDFEVNPCEGKLVAGTHGRGIWASPFAVPSEKASIEIAKDTEWGQRVLRSDVTVRSGATLTLRGEFRMAEGRKIRVEKDAKLVLDGAHLSELCARPWGGVELEEGSRGFLGLFFEKKAGELVLLNGAKVEGTK
jgi:hypothetical protein